MANGITEFWGTNPADPLKAALREHLRRRLTGEAVSPEPLLEQFLAHGEELAEQLRTTAGPRIAEPVTRRPLSTTLAFGWRWWWVSRVSVVRDLCLSVL